MVEVRFLLKIIIEIKCVPRSMDRASFAQTEFEGSNPSEHAR
jgi:hypothetical protein